MKKEILLSYFPKITPKRYQQLVALFSSLDTAWQMDKAELKQTDWPEAVIDEFITWKKQLNEDKIARIHEREDIYCLTQKDSDYPDLLKQIYDPPFCLFVRGQLKSANHSIAVVGTRKYTDYGKQTTDKIVRELVREDITVISGLALGIDGIAHEAALKNNGQTVAVLGTGINRQHIYPRANYYLAERIIENGGAIISEYPPGTLPTRWCFPRRNRIIAGMTIGTVITEAPAGSGALITAQYASNNNREVFAVPQNITSRTAGGVNQLIKHDAHLVTSGKDILEKLHLTVSQ